MQWDVLVGMKLPVMTLGSKVAEVRFYYTRYCFMLTQKAQYSRSNNLVSSTERDTLFYTPCFIDSKFILEKKQVMKS